MTMNGWKISDAKARLSEAIASTVEEPQVLYNRKEPVAALISYREFEEYVALKKAQQVPSMADMLAELNEINELEDDIQLPERIDRAMTIFED